MADLEDRIAAARGGGVRALARLVTTVESGGEPAAEIGRELAGCRRNAHVIGITGAPGAGKSTLTAALLRVLCPQSDRRIAVLAIDPSSPLTGGALLGDRVRMTEFATDPNVFIRSLSARGQLGGLSAGSPAVVDLLAALGFAMIIIETVGVGQSEVDIMALADSVAVVLAPGMGDSVQAAKAGILEIADLLVVNKADHSGAQATVRDLKAMVRVSGDIASEWTIPVLATVAESGSGVVELADSLGEHYRYLDESGQLEASAHGRVDAMIRALVSERLRAALAGDQGVAAMTAATESVMGGSIDPYTAADVVWRSLVP